MWQKFPVWFRAVVLGLVVSGVPTVVWALLAIVNVKLTPAIPWSVPAMAVVLWIGWRSLRSDERLRAIPLSPPAFRLALVAGGLGIAAVWAAFAAFRGVLHITPPPADDVSRLPIWTIATVIVMAATVAGVAEEAGFRGFMQLPLERQYGPFTAVAVTSVIFTAVHLTHGARILPFLPFYFVAAVIYGLLALTTGSILPSMLLHACGDVMMFVFQYLNVRFNTAAVAATGRIEIVPALVAIVLGGASVVVFRLLARPAVSAQVPAMSH
jgi:membrane protease YdiL (CAAX protease family)